MDFPRPFSSQTDARKPAAPIDEARLRSRAPAETTLSAPKHKPREKLVSPRNSSSFIQKRPIGEGVFELTGIMDFT